MATYSYISAWTRPGLTRVATPRKKNRAKNSCVTPPVSLRLPSGSSAPRRQARERQARRLLFPPACVCVPLDAAVTPCNVEPSTSTRVACIPFKLTRRARAFLPGDKIFNQINQRSSQSHTRARRSHIPAPPQRAAIPASRSDTGLGAC